MEYYVPFAYQKYGRIPVEAGSIEEAREKAEEKLKKMGLEEMESYAEYLSDSEEIDEEGVVLDEEGDIVSEDSAAYCEETVSLWVERFKEQNPDYTERDIDDEILDVLGSIRNNRCWLRGAEDLEDAAMYQRNIADYEEYIDRLKELKEKEIER